MGTGNNMAAPTCRLLLTCKLFEKLGLSSSACTISRVCQTRTPKVYQPHRCLAGGVPVSHSHPHPVCTPPAGVAVVPRRHSNWYVDKRIGYSLGVVGIPKVDPDYTPLTDPTEGQDLAHKVNCSLAEGSEGRLFAVVYIQDTQRKITAEDILVVEGDFPPSVGDKIRLEKVLMVGGKDFTLIGQPVLSRDQVNVEATVIEKTLSHNRVWSTYRRRSRYRKMKLFRDHHTMLVINQIQLAQIPEK